MFFFFFFVVVVCLFWWWWWCVCVCLCVGGSKVLFFPENSMLLGFPQLVSLWHVSILVFIFSCLSLSLFPVFFQERKPFSFFFPQSMLKHKTSPQFATSHKCPSVSAKALIVVQPLSRVQLFATSWTTAYQASLSFTISWSLLKLMSIESMMPSNHFILCDYQN